MFPSPFFHGFNSPFYIVDEKLIDRERRKRTNANKPVKSQKALAGNEHSMKIKSPLPHAFDYSEEIERNGLGDEETVVSTSSTTMRTHFDTAQRTLSLPKCKTCKFKKKLDLTIK